MQTTEDVNIPLYEIPKPKNHYLKRWLVANGSRVGVGEALFELETDESIYPVQSFESGFIKFLGEEGQRVEVGETVAQIFCISEDERGVKELIVDVSHEDTAIIDGQRGELSRRDWLASFLHDSLQGHRKGEQGNGINEPTGQP